MIIKSVNGHILWSIWSFWIERNLGKSEGKNRICVVHFSRRILGLKPWHSSLRFTKNSILGFLRFIWIQRNFCSHKISSRRLLMIQRSSNASEFCSSLPRAFETKISHLKCSLGAPKQQNRSISSSQSDVGQEILKILVISGHVLFEAWTFPVRTEKFLPRQPFITSTLQKTNAIVFDMNFSSVYQNFDGKNFSFA